MPSLKRSASEARFSNSPSKCARKSMYRSGSETEVNASPRNQSLSERWGELLVDTVKAVGNLIWKSSYTFRDKLLPMTSEDTSNESPKVPQARTGQSKSNTKQPLLPTTDTFAIHTPTNVLASSSNSPPLRRPPPPSSSAPKETDPKPETRLFSSSSETVVSSRLDTLQPECEQMLYRLRELSGGVQKKYKRRPHILENEHKQRTREILFKRLHELQKAFGYSSDLESFKSYIQYRKRLENLQKVDRYYLQNPRQQTQQPVSEDDDAYIRRAIENAKKSLNSPKPLKPYNPAIDKLDARFRTKTERIRNRLHPKRKPIPDSLPLEAQKEVNLLLEKQGVISKVGREQVSDRDLCRLKPGQWLNDEIINFYGQLIVERASEAVEAKENEKGKILNAHYLSSFFWTKLQSGYEKGRLAKWTKKLDIFSKDIILMPVNHGNSHWTSAAINFRQKRFEAYDSMGSDCARVFEALRSYVDAEHKNKKNKPFDFTGWVDRRIDNYPEQENGYDCGVFTCQTLEFLSRGEEEFAFTQKDMPYLRQRMIWEIGRAKLGDPL